MMTYNYHTHTARCGHATGEDRDYIENAIKAGLEILGFSDHAPFAFPVDHVSKHRVQPDRAEEYVSTFQAYREEYRDRIALHIGYEMEYYPLFHGEMIDFIRRHGGAEYLILGQHFLDNELVPGDFIGKAVISEEAAKQYVQCVCEGMKSEHFSYVAHPDLITTELPEEQYLALLHPICVLSRELDIPLEINLLGIRDGRKYPKEAFWKMAGEEHCPVIFGSDAHRAEDVSDESSYRVAMDWTAKYGLDLCKNLTLRPILPYNKG